jgi:preprotein translocase subunit SecG
LPSFASAVHEILHTPIVIVHVIACAILILAVLLQPGKSGGLGAFSGVAAQQVFGGRGAGNFLTKITWTTATTFFLTSVTLAYLSSSADVSLAKRHKPAVTTAQSSSPAKSAAPAEPAKPAAPAKSSAPTESKDPTEPAAPMTTESPAEPAAPAEPVKPVPPTKPAKPALPAAPAKPAAPAAPAKAKEPAEPAAPQSSE